MGKMVGCADYNKGEWVQIDIDAVQAKIDRAYTTLICHQPFFSCMLLRLERLMDPWIPTAGTDGKRLLWNPAFVNGLTQDELVGVLCHEVLHVASLHPWRRNRRDSRAWNIACDQVVNEIVLKAHFALPADRIPGVADKSAEELYKDPTDNGGKGGKGKGAGATVTIKGAPGGGPPNGQHQDPGGCGGVLDPSNADGSQLSEAERETQMAEAKIGVQQALNAAKQAGKLPAGMERLIDQLQEPRVPWREILSRFIDGQVKHDFSWLHPSRRYAGSGFMFPSMNSPGYGKVCFAGDTSGSIGQEELREIASEILGCLDTYAERGQEPELTVIWCDAEIAAVQEVTDAEDIKPAGGGGTSFAPVMQYLREQDMKPAALIYVTDGYCNDFGKEPDCPVLWILTRTNDSFKPPFGEVTCTLHDGH